MFLCYDYSLLAYVFSRKIYEVWLHSKVERTASFVKEMCFPLQFNADYTELIHAVRLTKYPPGLR